MECDLIPTHLKDCPWHSDWHQCSCGLFDILIYVKQREDDSPVTHRLTVEGAIQRQFNYAKAMNYHYLSQDEALQDFVAVHRAWFEKI